MSSVNACVWGRAPPRATSDSRVIGMLSWQKCKEQLACLGGRWKLVLAWAWWTRQGQESQEEVVAQLTHVRGGHKEGSVPVILPSIG